jgi:hypothetical protein
MSYNPASGICKCGHCEFKHESSDEVIQHVKNCHLKNEERQIMEGRVEDGSPNITFSIVDRPYIGG